MEHVVEQNTEPQEEATAPLSMAETPDQQLELSAELHADELTIGEPPEASTQQLVCLASPEQRVVETTNLPKRTSDQPEDILTNLEDD